MNIEKRTEAIGNLDDVEVVWENIAGPFIIDNKVHMPLVPEENLTQKDIETFRGYIDHEVRHKRHTHGWNDLVESEFRKNPALKNVVNCLEDVRIELQDGKRGEQQNLRNLRKDFAVTLETKINEYEDFSCVVSAFMYRRLGIDLILNEEKESVYKKFQPYWVEFDTCENVQDICKLAKKMFENENVKSNKPEFEDPNSSNEPSEQSEETGCDEAEKSGSGSGSGFTSNEDENSGSNEDENSGSGSNEEKDEKSDSGSDEDEKSDMSEQDNTGISGDDQFLNKDEEKSTSDSKNTITDDDGVDSEEDENAERKVGKNDDKNKNGSTNDWDKVTEELDEQSIENLLKDKIEETVASYDDEDVVKRAINTFTSYTSGDLHRYYSVDKRSRWSGWDIEDDSPINVSQMTKGLVRVLYSKTDNFKLNGFKKGKRISKTRLAGFSQGLSDKPFYKEINSDQLDAKISILVDLSGSMSGFISRGKRLQKSRYKSTKIFQAISFAYTIGCALGKIKGVDFEIVGFYSIAPRVYSGDWYDIHAEKSKVFASRCPKVYEYFHSFGEKFKPKSFKNICQQILDCHAGHHSEIPEMNNGVSDQFSQFGRCNADSETLFHTIKKMNQTRKKDQNQFVFVISDGQPNANLNEEKLGVERHNLNAVNCGHLKKIIDLSREKFNINVLGFGFSDASEITRLYGEKNSVYRPKFDELSKDFVKELEKKLIGCLK